MNKKLKIFLFFVFGLITFCSGTFASSIMANQITFKPTNELFSTTNVAAAIDSLYQYAAQSATRAERMMNPTIWPVSEEIDFGGGIYG